MLIGHDRIRAQAMGESVARRFAQTISHGAGGIQIRATVSVGLAHAASDAPALTNLLAAADRALYRAKSLGGNRLEVAQSEPHAAPARDELMCGSSNEA